MNGDHGLMPYMEKKSMLIETKFLRLRNPVALGDRIDGWRVCWLGGWDRGRVFYVVMVERTRTDGPAGVGPSSWALTTRL